MNNDFRRLSEASGGRQARSTTVPLLAPRQLTLCGGSLDTNDKAAYFPEVHRHWVGALLGIAAGTSLAVAAGPAAAEGRPADVGGPESRLETGSVQYGAAFTAELLASAGAICPVGATVPCVIGSGG